MRVLVATEQTQGERDSDFFGAIEGELVIFGFDCDCDCDLDQGCGCRRSVIGATSERTTTTFRVAELDIDYQEYVAVIRARWHDWGWSDYLTDEDIERDAQDALELAALFPVGAVLERRRWVVAARALPPREAGAEAPPTFL